MRYMGFEYESFQENGVKIVGYSGKEKFIIVPHEIGGKPVRAIAGGAFAVRGDIKSVTIPASVVSFGEYAFGWIFDKENNIYVRDDDLLIFCSPGTACVKYALENGFFEDNIIAADTDDIYVSNDVDENVVSELGLEAFRQYEKLGVVNVPLGTPASRIYFKCCEGLRHIIIPEGTDVIEYASFGYCKNLTSVSLPEGLKVIDERAFEGCISLGSITIPKTVTSIGNSAFYDCSSLEAVTIGEGVTCIDGSAFLNCTALKSVTIPASVTYVGEYAFGWTYDRGTNKRSAKFEDFTICCYPDTAGERYAKKFGFEYELIVPPLPNTRRTADNVVFIMDRFLKPKKPTGITIEYGMLSDRDEIYIPEKINGIPVTAIGEGAFFEYKKLRSVVIPKSVNVIKKAAFGSCSDLRILTIAEGVENIEEYAFALCESLERVILPKSLKNLGMSAFNSCRDLLRIDIPEGVRSIGKGAFFGCEKLSSITIPKSVTYIGEHALAAMFNRKNEKEIIQANTAIFCYAGTEGERYAKENQFIYEIIDEGEFHADTETVIERTDIIDEKELVIPRLLGGKAVRIIGRRAFFNSKARRITIPEGVVELREASFKSSAYLTNVSIPKSVKKIGNNAFENCRSLKSAVIPEGVGIISKSAFINCKSLSEVTIPNSLIVVGSEAFKGCTALTEISFPESVDKIKDHAFEDCISLKKVNLPDGLKVIDLMLFNSCKSLAEIKIPENVKVICPNAFCRCASLKSVTIPANVKLIRHSAFCLCTNLTDLTISEGVEKIEKWAFINCTDLMSVTIPGSVTEIGEEAFGFYHEHGESVRIEGFKIYCYSGTQGENYALQNGFDYELSDQNSADTFGDSASEAPVRDLRSAAVNVRPSDQSAAGTFGESACKTPWQALKSAIKKNYPALEDHLNEGASEEEIAELESKLGVELPEQLKAVYSENNGEKEDSPWGIIGGFRLYTLDEIYLNRKYWKDLYDETDSDTLAEMSMFSESRPENCIKKQYIDLKWIPLCDDGGGNHIGIDLDPDIEGRSGQVINFGPDEDEKIVIANDIDAFLGRLLRIFGGDGIRLTEEGFKPADSDHFIDYLKSDEAIK